MSQEINNRVNLLIEQHLARLEHARQAFEFYSQTANAAGVLMSDSSGAGSTTTPPATINVARQLLFQGMLMNLCASWEVFVDEYNNIDGSTEIDSYDGFGDSERIKEIFLLRNVFTHPGRLSHALQRFQDNFPDSPFSTDEIAEEDVSEFFDRFRSVVRYSPFNYNPATLPDEVDEVVEG